ncbi:MAG TPA: allantoate amidohydrolase [Ktedonobacteraceae bacterium]|nr:allantoate amidohydrolase [Chthonomonadales bacterium]HEV2580854.1 allantoate amidohydrolase [Ktedonobacteraceae bacterium]
MSSEAAMARTVMEWCEVLGAISEEPDCLSRPFATQAMRRANATVSAWMRDAGMQVEQDAIGNLIGRYEGSSTLAKTLVLGSHLDSVRDAGKYDGPLGVMIALACVQRLHSRGERLPFAIEVVGFADEEGMRFARSYLGSRAITGMFESTWLEAKDAQEMTMAEAIRDFGGNPDPLALRTPRWKREALLGYAEVHIEQGPVLEEANLPLGVVTAIAGQTRLRVGFTGMAGHAGTVPMPMRRDALSAAAEFALGVEAIARGLPGLVATIGQAQVQPGVSNVIPGQVMLSLDVRHQHDTIREQALIEMEARGRIIGEARHITFTWQALETQKAVPCAPYLANLFAQAIEASGYPAHRLPSGAGHDAAIMSALTDMAMLFVRCKGGISHNPAESVTSEDVGLAIDTLERFLLLLAGTF